MKHTRGFTMIELIVVITILGILAATALPRFISVQSEARKASVNGMAGGVRSAAALAKAAWLVAGASGANVTMDGAAVAVNTSGYPTGTATGIGAALSQYQGFTLTPDSGGTAYFTPETGGSATCRVAYVAATGSATADVSNCN